MRRFTEQRALAIRERKRARSAEVHMRRTLTLSPSQSAIPVDLPLTTFQLFPHLTAHYLHAKRTLMPLTCI